MEFKMNVRRACIFTHVFNPLTIRRGERLRFSAAISFFFILTRLIAAAPPTTESSIAPDNRDGFTSRWLVEKRVSNSEVRYGYVDRRGHLAIPLKYQGAYSFQDGLAAVLDSDKWQFIDTDGRIIFKTPAGTNDFGHFSDGLVAVHVGGKVGFQRVDGGEWYYVDAHGNCAFARKFTAAYDSPLHAFSEGLAGVRTGEKWGIIDRAGSEIVPPRYEMILPFTNGMAAVKEKGKWGFIDKDGHVAIPILFNSASPFSEGLTGVNMGKGLVFIDKSGAPVLQVSESPSLMGSFSEGLAAILLPEEGPVRLGFQCVECQTDLSGLSYGDKCRHCGAVIEPRVMWGYVDHAGKRIVPPRFSAAFPFKNHLAAVRQGEEADARWGFIDRNGTVQIPCTFLEVIGDGFEGDLASVVIAGKNAAFLSDSGENGYIDVHGHFVWPESRVLPRP